MAADALAPHDPAALDDAALRHAAALAPLLTARDGRVRPELRALNWGGSRAALARPPVISDTGRWQAIDTDGQTGIGRGAVALVAWIARVEPARAAGFLTEILHRLGALS